MTNGPVHVGSRKSRNPSFRDLLPIKPQFLQDLILGRTGTSWIIKYVHNRINYKFHWGVLPISNNKNIIFSSFTLRFFGTSSTVIYWVTPELGLEGFGCRLRERRYSETKASVLYEIELPNYRLGVDDRNFPFIFK